MGCEKVLEALADVGDPVGADGVEGVEGALGEEGAAVVEVDELDVGGAEVDAEGGGHGGSCTRRLENLSGRFDTILELRRAREIRGVTRVFGRICHAGASSAGRSGACDKRMRFTYRWRFGVEVR